ncbi:HAMP domain-containing sensor histidine kinase [soil metagenome]
MKLLNVTNRYYIIIAVALMLIGCGFLTYRLLYLFDREITEHMLYEKQIIDQQLYEEKQLQHMNFKFGDHIEVQPIDKFTTFRVHLRDTEMFDPLEKDVVAFRILSYEQQIDSTGYRIKIRRRLTKNDDVMYGVLVAVALISFNMVLSFYFLNRWFSIKIWAPFYAALKLLKNYDLRKDGKPQFRTSAIEEFNRMNEELRKLTDKVSSDYRNLKEFTENMSHETQTPLAIIHSRLDVLMQSENLNEQQQEQIRTTLDAVNRLSKMNKGLTLLAKIDNNQFADEHDINLGNVIEKHLSQLDIFIEGKGIRVIKDLNPRVNVRLNPQLVDILLTNLLSNAIKYNEEHGMLKITLDNKGFVISNTGDAPSLSSEQIFERFKRGEDKIDSTGLGMAIVKKICDYSSCEISHNYFEPMHVFTVSINPSKVKVT